MYPVEKTNVDHMMYYIIIIYLFLFLFFYSLRFHCVCTRSKDFFIFPLRNLKIYNGSVIFFLLYCIVRQHKLNLYLCPNLDKGKLDTWREK